MIDQLDVETTRTVARLAQSRAELIDLLTADHRDEAEARANGTFPRSHTIRVLMRSGGLRALAALAAGVLVSRPATAWRLLRALPLGALARSLLTRIVISIGSSR